MQASAAALTAVGLGLVYFLWSEAPPAPVAADAGPVATTTRLAGGTLPRIDLGRLEAARGELQAGKRDLFNFGVPPAPPTMATSPLPPPTSIAEEAPAPVTAPTPAPLNVKYIGSLDRKGLKVAIFMSDKLEILTGQEGEVVANRLKVVKIGFESVDVQDVGSDRVRRIPMRGN